MKYDNLVSNLLEGISPSRNFYHITVMANAANIIKKDVFELAEQDETGEELFPKFKYYLSAARILSNSYFKSYSFIRPIVIFELDGSKLSDKGYVIKPIHDYHSIKAPNFESEDRILTNKPFIKNAKTFIKSINLFFPKDTKSDYNQPGIRSASTVKEASDIFMNSGISTFVFNDKHAFLLLDKRKAKHLN